MAAEWLSVLPLWNCFVERLTGGANHPWTVFVDSSWFEDASAVAENVSRMGQRQRNCSMKRRCADFGYEKHLGMCLT